MRLFFKNITIMSKGEWPKLKGTIYNFSVDVVDVCNTLPRASDFNGLVIVRLKWKLEYRISDSNGIRTHNHLVSKRTLNHLAHLVECSFTN